MINNDYLKSNNIQELFEALTDSLLLTQPADIIQHLQDSLENVKNKGLEEFKYANYHSTISSAMDNSCIKGFFRCKLMPDANQCKGDSVNEYKVIIILSAPGETPKIGKILSKLFHNFGYIHMGKCLRNRIQKESQKGISRWKVSKSLINNGDFVPEDVALVVLLDEIKNISSKDLIIIEGYPKNEKQIKDFDDAIGIERILKVFIVDSFESECRSALLKCYDHQSNNSEFGPYETSRKLANYKAYTLPVLKYFDDNQKLVIIQNAKNNIDVMKTVMDHLIVQQPDIINKYRNLIVPLEEIQNNINITKQKIWDGIIPFQNTLTGNVLNAEQLYIIKPPVKRTYNMSKIPLVLIQGGPNSGKTMIAKKICKQLFGWYHCDFSHIVPFSMIIRTLEEYKTHCCALKQRLETVSSFVAGIILENFPKTSMELSLFNEEIGNVDLQLFIDVSDFNMSMRYLRQQNIKVKEDGTDISRDNALKLKSMLDYYKQIIMPTIRYFSDKGLSFNINGDQEFDTIASQCVGVMKSVFY